jgi:hypothetical protein
VQRFSGQPAQALWGQPRDLLVPSPAGGADISILLPSGYRYRILSLFATFTAGAAAASRQPSLIVADGDGLVRYRTPWPGAVTEGKAAAYTAGSGAPTAGELAAGAFSIEPPGWLLPAGWRIGTLTSAINALDQWSTVRVLWEELVDDYPAHAAGHQHRPHLEIDLEVAPHA